MSAKSEGVCFTFKMFNYESMKIGSLLSRLLLFANGLSLDAPLVAVAWQEIAAHQLNGPLQNYERLLLFMATWLVYAGDRLLDSRGVLTSVVDIPRHQFVARNFWPLLCLWIVLLMTTAVMTWLCLNPSAILIAVFILGLLGGYFALCLWLPIARWVIPREVIVSLFFIVAVLFFPLLEASPPINQELAFTLIRFSIPSGGLILLNCLGIASWEAEMDRQAGESTLATRFPFVVKFFPGIAIATGIVFLLIDRLLVHEWNIFGGSVCTAAIMIGLLDSAWIPQDLKPILADAMLIVPFAIQAIVL